ncbi:type II/IV secretion system ATPase subunit [Methanolobus halotolerans]|uniref:Type II secretion system protein E n=1 Tax=Methanolobus halotolerans TaxID=2052935 RepID=A0A4E0Q4B3_9EURY|nr:type II/IV secretion system ATPase subunit [Methanolobus halotolerans]TGC08497.1 type II secretion system protein E [Methanolobus halotolerans]
MKASVGDKTVTPEGSESEPLQKERDTYSLSCDDIMSLLASRTPLAFRIVRTIISGRIIESISSRIFLPNSRKERTETYCPYRLRFSKNYRTIILNCSECALDSSFESPDCRRRIFRILQKEPAVDRLVFSRLYERDYEGMDLNAIYTLSQLQERLSAYSTSELVNKKCPHASSSKKCESCRRKLLETAIETSGHDPLKACMIMDWCTEQFGLKNKLYGEFTECDPCLLRFIDTLEEMSNHTVDIQKALNIVRFPENPEYERYLRSYVRPPFSTSRIYTEPPENTLFLECYDISHKDERSLPVSIYQLTDRPEKMYIINPVEYFLEAGELKLLEGVRKKMIRHRPKDLYFADPSNSRNYFRLLAKRLLAEEARMNRMNLEPSGAKLYSDILVKYTTGLGILEDLLSDERVTDVYVNAPADRNPVHVVIDGEECISNIYLSQEDMDSMVSRLRSISGRPFGEATPVLEMFLKEYDVRVSVIGDPLSAKGIAYAFRKHAKDPWTLPRLINTGSISSLSAGLLSFMMDAQASVLVAGGVGAGKTSLLSAMLLEIPQKYRILTIEDTPEIPIEDLQDLGWKVQGLNSQSAILKYGIEIEPSTALRASLRLGSSSLVMGEVRGPEVGVLYEAMQVGAAGNSVIGTIHGSSTGAVYERIVHTLGVPPASFKATDAVIVCSNTRISGSMSTKRRVIQISEVNRKWDEEEIDTVFSDLFRYDPSVDSLLPEDILDRGQSALIAKIAGRWDITIDQALGHIRLRARIKGLMAEYGRTDPFFVKASAVSTANNMFWLLMGEERYCEDGTDLQRVYSKWLDWFANFASGKSSFFRTDPEQDVINPRMEEIPAGGHSEQW